MLVRGAVVGLAAMGMLLGFRGSLTGQSATEPVLVDPTELVVLVHGMGRTPISMLPLELHLEDVGYRVMNFGYSSYGPDVSTIGQNLAAALAEELSARPATRVHFVGHSLGNIIVRWTLAYQPPEAELGRFLMLAPPNRGSSAADRMAPFVGWLLTPIRELRTTESTVRALPPLDGIDFAIVAGKDDGKVSVAETCLQGASDHVVVPSAHTFIMLPPSIHLLIDHFLATGEIAEDVERVPAGTCVSGF